MSPSEVEIRTIGFLLSFLPLDLADVFLLLLESELEYPSPGKAIKAKIKHRTKTVAFFIGNPWIVDLIRNGIVLFKTGGKKFLRHCGLSSLPVARNDSTKK